MIDLATEERRYSPTQIVRPNQIFLKDLRNLRENTKIFVCKETDDGIERERRQFIKLNLSDRFASPVYKNTWSMVTRGIDGETLHNPLRGCGAARSIKYNGWRQDAWLELNTED